MNNSFTVVRVIEPQPMSDGYGGWCWPIPEHLQQDGCATLAVTASRQWWHYLPPGCCPLGNVGYMFCIGNITYKVESISAQIVNDLWVWVAACQEVRQ